MAKILSGEKFAKSIILKLKRKQKKGFSLAVVQAGENPVSAKYVGEKRKVAEELGAGFLFLQLPQSVSQKKLEQEIVRLGKNKKVSGVLVQLPLPSRLNAQKALDLIPKEKDVDVLSSASFADFALGTLPVLPPTVAAIALLLKETKVRIEKSRAAVVGAGKLVGLPVALWLAHQGASISLLQKGTRNASALISTADIVISGVGKPGLITGKNIKKGAVVIDAGTSVEGGSTRGDVDFESVSRKASYLTPVPGGVGPLTVACLFQNLFALNSKQ